VSTRTPACWKWKPPADIGAVLLHETMRQRWLKPGETELAPKYAQRLEGQAEWRLLWDWHKGRCAICGRRRDDNRFLVTDHDHETELIRGLLCRSCNTLEGGGDSRENEFTRYRERPPAVICGVRLVYIDPWGGSRIFVRRPSPAVSPDDQHPG
jgi:hypothetical protein